MFTFMNDVLRRVIVYGFPVVFIAIEFLIRTAMQHFGIKADARGFIPATLASAGIGQLFPVVVIRDKTKLLSKKARAQLKERGLSANSEADNFVVTLAWIAIVALTVIWAALIYQSLTAVGASGESGEDALLLGLKTLNIGIGTYFVGVVLAEAKEWV